MVEQTQQPQQPVIPSQDAGLRRELSFQQQLATVLRTVSAAGILYALLVAGSAIAVFAAFAADPVKHTLAMAAAIVLVALLTVLAPVQAIVNFVSNFENLSWFTWMRDRNANQIEGFGRSLSVLFGFLGLLALAPAAFTQNWSAFRWIDLPLAIVLMIEIYYFALRQAGRGAELNNNLAGTGRTFRRALLLVIGVMLVTLAAYSFGFINSWSGEDGVRQTVHDGIVGNYEVVTDLVGKYSLWLVLGVVLALWLVRLAWNHMGVRTRLVTASVAAAVAIGGVSYGIYKANQPEQIPYTSLANTFAPAPTSTSNDDVPRNEQGQLQRPYTKSELKKKLADLDLD